MVQELQGKFKSLISNKWFVFIPAMWVQSMAGIGYLFGSISPLIKSKMGYSQREVAMLGVAKNMGDSIGFVAGSLCEILPIWAIFLIGVLHNLFGYGLVWLVITQNWTSLPLWVVFVLIFIGTNGVTYYQTGTLVSCVKNFPKSQGHVVGILKGFVGLSGPILTQFYLLINSGNYEASSSLILLVTLGPCLVVTSSMFVIRPIRDDKHKFRQSEDNPRFLFAYIVCLALAIFSLAILLVEDLIGVNLVTIMFFVIVIIIFLLVPLVIPIQSLFVSKQTLSIEESLITPVQDELELLDHARSEEEFTVLQALLDTNFLIMFLSLTLAAGSGLTIFDNLGQITQSLGYTNTSMYVSMISIWNSLGRVVGGYFSEVIIRKFGYPRPLGLAIVQLIMATGLSYYYMGWPGKIYVTTILVGLSYGAHWSIVPASISDLFGLKNFGVLCNFINMSCPIGSIVISGVIASGIYDYYAKKQREEGSTPSSTSPLIYCDGLICYSSTCGIMSCLCLLAAFLSLVVVYRTKSVYVQLMLKG